MSELPGEARRDEVGEALLDSSNLSVIDWVDERYQNAKRIAKTKTGKERQGWLEDASYLLRCREALKQLATASGDEHANVPLRMHIALRIISAWNYGEAGFSAVILGTVNDWIKGGMKDPIPWPESPFFTEWAEQAGYAKIGPYIGFRFQARLSSGPVDQKTGGAA